MPKISGREILSESTEKAQGRLLLIASIAIVSKAYRLPISDLKIFGMDFPAPIFDVSMLLLVTWYGYNYFVRWVGDLMAFRLWYSESSIWSNFGTNMKLDKTFIAGGIDALKVFNEIQRQNLGSDGFGKLSDDKRQLYEDFKTNVELYALRLDYAGRKFKAISAFGHFYVWVQGFLLPASAAALAIYLLLKFGAFSTPVQF